MHTTTLTKLVYPVLAASLIAAASTGGSTTARAAEEKSSRINGVAGVYEAEVAAAWVKFHQMLRGWASNPEGTIVVTDRQVAELGALVPTPSEAMLSEYVASVRRHHNTILKLKDILADTESSAALKGVARLRLSEAENQMEVQRAAMTTGLARFKVMESIANEITAFQQNGRSLDRKKSPTFVRWIIELDLLRSLKAEAGVIVGTVDELLRTEELSWIGGARSSLEDLERNGKMSGSDPNEGRIAQAAGKTLEISQLSEAPRPKFQARPTYPFEMRRAGVTGVVLVDFIVDTNGDVQNAYALRSSKKEFEAAAVEAVSRWTFRPGMKGARPVNTHMQIPIVFSLDQDD